MAHGGGGYVHLRGCAREAQLPRRRLEGAQRIKRREAAGHGVPCGRRRTDETTHSRRPCESRDPGQATSPATLNSRFRGNDGVENGGFIGTHGLEKLTYLTR